MSRTKNHAPYWVLTARKVKENGNVVTYHRHALFGQPVTQRYLERDSKGAPVYEVVAVPVSFYDLEANGYYNSLNFSKPSQDNQLNKKSGFFKIEGHEGLFKRVQRLKYSKRVIGYYATTCCAGEPVDRYGRTADGAFSPCSSYLPHYENKKSYDNTKVNREKHVNTAGNRKIIANKLHNAAKIAKSEDFDDSDYVIFESTHKPARQKYWD